jgi:hypothetical protein
MSTRVRGGGIYFFCILFLTCPIKGSVGGGGIQTCKVIELSVGNL